MSDIQSLTAEAQRLSLSVDTWNFWIIIGMLLTAVAATGLVIIQFKAFRQAKLLSDTQEKLIYAKDARLAKDLSEKDGLIASANERASMADERAAEANLALAKFRAPRLPNDKVLASLIEAIKGFREIKFDVGHSQDDREQWNFLWRLEPTISKAGWAHTDWIGGEVFRKEGWGGNHWYGRASVINVSVEVHPENRERLKPAAEALAEALRGIGIDATTGDFNNSSTNTNAIHILVGQKR